VNENDQLQMISSEQFGDIKDGLKAVGLAAAAERLSLKDFTPAPSSDSALSSNYLQVFDQLLGLLSELDNGIVIRRCTSMSEVSSLYHRGLMHFIKLVHLYRSSMSSALVVHTSRRKLPTQLSSCYHS
jgi:hypothetical protein